MAWLVCLSLIALTLGGIGSRLGRSRIYDVTALIGEPKLPAAVIRGIVRGQTAAMQQYMLEVSNRGDGATVQASFKKACEQKQQAEMVLVAAIVEFEKVSLTEDEQNAWKEFKTVWHAMGKKVIQNGSKRVVDAAKWIGDSVKE